MRRRAVCELLDVKPGDHTAEADVTATGLCLRALAPGEGRPHLQWERGYQEAWRSTDRHRGTDEQRAIVDALTPVFDAGEGRMRDDDRVLADAAQAVLKAGWSRRPCCGLCALDAHETDEGHTYGEQCCLYCPAKAAA